jgi:TonB-linked SusC/RagA family outer membrane protein
MRNNDWTIFPNSVHQIKFFSKIPFVLFALLFNTHILQASFNADLQQEEIRVEGKVLDQNGEPVIGAHVVVKNSSVATITNVNGIFTLNTTSNAVITVSSLGYAAAEVRVAGNRFLNIVLYETALELEETIVVGYGTLSKREVTSSISKVKGENLNRVSIPSVSAALKGKTTGLRVHNTSGAPGVQAVITIRGGSSINKSNDALVLIDGMPGSFSSVNPQDVESIEVLKDAASTAIYGARASNGIVLITTKSGKSGKPVINANVSYGYQNSYQKMNKLNAEQYLTLFRPALQRSPYSNYLDAAHPAGTGNTDNSAFSTRYLNEGEAVPLGWKSMPDPIDPSRTLIFEDNDLQDQVFSGGNYLNAYISLNGGGERSKYMVSLGYIGDESFTPKRDWESLTLRTNATYDVTKKLKLITNISAQKISSIPYASEPAIFSTGIHLAPTIRSVMPDGTIPQGKDASYKNPMYIIEHIENKRQDLRLSAKVGLEWTIIEGLTAKGEAIYNNSSFHREYFEKSNIYNNLRPSNYYGGIDHVNQYDLSLNYAKEIVQGHRINAVIGTSSLGWNIYTYQALAEGATRDDLMTQNSSSVYKSSSSNRERELLNSAFGRVTYSYKSKLMSSFSLRADGSSKFAKGYRWGYFPGVSVGYIISEEEFMKGIDWLSLVKLRASYGLTGNNSVGRYTYQGVWRPIGDSYLGETAFAPSAMGNRALTWETSHQLDFGVDLAFFKNRINLVLDYYDKTTNDLLFSENLPNTSGFGSIEKNIGTVKFWGYEAELSAKIIQNKNFQWELGTNISYNLNKVLKLPDNGNYKNRIGGLNFADDYYAGVGGTAEGERMYGIVGYKVSHVLDTDEAAAAAYYDERARGWDPVSKTYQTGRKIAGDYEWIDKDGDERITPKDQYVLGYLVPTTTGGFNTTFSYKGWELYALFDYALGHVIYDRQVSLVDAGAQAGYLSPTTTVLDFWQQPGDAANTKYARFDINDSDNNGQWNHYRTSDRNVYKGDYLSFRELKLGYSLPKSVLNILKVNKLYAYASGQNVYTFSAYPGYITEYSGGSRNLGDGNFPLSRIWSIGFNATF